MNEATPPPQQTSLDSYFANLSEHALLTKEEERQVGLKIRAWKDSKKAGQQTRKNGKQALKTLVECNLRLVIKIAKDYRNLGLDFSDLVCEGNIGLIKAAERFDPSHGTRFSTYCSYWIRQAIRRGLSNKSRTIRLPVGLIDQQKKVRNFINDFTEKNKRSPSSSEICEHFNLCSIKLSILLDFEKSTLSLDSPPPSSEESNSTLSDTIPDALIKSPDSLASISSDHNVLELCLKKLNRRERAIIEYRFGLKNKDHETLEKIGIRFRVTRERIRQIEEAALRKLRFWIKKYKVK
tara:strand:- start:5110 stop:5991 length:882 start_codon:yes stop_codon:yes gene_type:complete